MKEIIPCVQKDKDVLICDPGIGLWTVALAKEVKRQSVYAAVDLESPNVQQLSANLWINLVWNVCLISSRKPFNQSVGLVLLGKCSDKYSNHLALVPLLQREHPIVVFECVCGRKDICACDDMLKQEGYTIVGSKVKTNGFMARKNV